ncbi:hypothetical protein N7474_008947 [Penicillium riverlandense]|uniref:uncharacterized protein n=1 Tax=Penicillium riverlandense TaxID=1903569 RepID=UPI002546DB14|nr:uncharacterized protein N7474_008947 [Penicillium riverlandense]KAJ5812646.1 hypothetical protein N7474_008947 [Penicillium riverlandense]
MTNPQKSPRRKMIGPVTAYDVVLIHDDVTHGTAPSASWISVRIAPTRNYWRWNVHHTREILLWTTNDMVVPPQDSRQQIQHGTIPHFGRCDVTGARSRTDISPGQCNPSREGEGDVEVKLMSRDCAHSHPRGPEL